MSDYIYIPVANGIQHKKEKGGDEIIIELLDMELDTDQKEQFAKVVEEWSEFLIANYTVKRNLSHIAEEAFDIMQALAGYLDRLGVDIHAANYQHLEKLRGRMK